MEKTEKTETNEMDTFEKSESFRRILSENIFIGIVAFAVLFVIAVTSYRLVYDKIIEISIQNMEEVAKHDERMMRASIEYKWDTLSGIAKNLEQEHCETEEDLLLRLNTSQQLIECIRLTVIADDGYALQSNMVITSHEEIMHDLEKLGSRFIYRGDYRRVTDEGEGEVLIMGVKIDPFTVDGKTYTYIACRMDIDTLQNELKIDSYDGRGYSSVIDRDGNYLVNINLNYTIQSGANFFEEVELGELSQNDSVDSIRQRIENEESFFVSHTNEDDEMYVMSFTPMADLDWYFITSVPRDVFEDQVLYLLAIFVVLIGIVLVAGAVIVIIIMQRRSRTFALEIMHRKKLSEALALAQQASKAKTTFLNNMSHDIRTPMNAIIGFTALATTHIDNKERVKDYLEKISQSSNHLLSLINDVLDMSRIESGKVVIDEKAENLADILHNIANIVQADIHAKQLELFVDTVNVTDEDIFCDRLRLNQILLNLLSNAMKFTNPGGTVSIRIMQMEGSEEGYGKYEFRVKDTGIGISEDFLKTIFEPFTREQSSTVSRIQGTGLGMSITKNIVDMMGGKIEVESEVNKGTEFIVTLEFKLQSEHKEIEVIKEIEGLRALVVDDDLNACQSVSKMLRQVGMRAEWTMYGKEAVARTQEAIEMGDGYDMYIIDWLMPDMNGLETVRRIRKVAGEAAPIIILSAYDWSDIESEAKESGVTDFVSKPLFMSDLNLTLKRVFKEKVSENSSPKTISVQESFSGKRILLVEDIDLNREIATVILEESGFIVESAENGQEAYDMVRSSEPGYYSFVLMDIQMPVMNGYDATRAIRKLENKKLSDIPIIAMTADTFEEDKKTADEAGMNGHIGKPINIPLMLETLKEVLKKGEK